MNAKIYLNKISQLFAENANSENAVKMSKYMRNQFAFFGLASPKRETLSKAFVQEFGYPDNEILDEVILSLWEAPQRELQYFAMEILVKMMRKAPENRIILYEKLLISKSWWDTIDLIAAKLVGMQIKLYPSQIDIYIEKWRVGQNFWLNRTAILFQLKYKQHTDFELLKRCIEPHRHESEFFLRKAIGWALREYSKTNAAAVLAYIDSVELSPLSRTEAVKWLKSKNRI